MAEVDAELDWIEDTGPTRRDWSARARLSSEGQRGDVNRRFDRRRRSYWRGHASTGLEAGR